jgi:alpha-N-acetylglucosaminidase
MKHLVTLIAGGVLATGMLMPINGHAQSPTVSQPQPAVQAAQALIGRLLPKHTSQFILDIIPADQGKDVFEIESKDGKVVLRGNSALSMSVGLNWYLKYTCYCQVSFNGNQLALPEQLPVVKEKVRQIGWAKSRYFLNYCTFSYSMSWWDWTQWEKFIDWMALNGINQPLAITGQEAIWQAVGKRFDMTDAEIESFLAGPPYLPFQWMGCLDGHGGPLPKNWIPQHIELEKKILARERALGMTPVLQGFTGHLPEAILKKFPGAKAQRIKWIEFNTWMLEPTDPLFQKLGTAFIEEQTRLFGTDHLYAADSFIEMTPPSGDLTYLANTGRAIYEGMAKADPKAVWFLQGWTFMNQAHFWKQDRIKAFLDAVPNEHLLILDLYCETRPVWNQTQGFYGKPWNWSFVYNFGNRVEFPTASLAAFDGLDAARQTNLGQNIQGVGLMMEGFGHHPMIFDLMFELAWREGKVDRAAWMKDYIHRRYGQENAHATRAWDRLLAGPYARTTGGYAATFTVMIPSDNPPHVACPEARLAWSELLQAAPELGHHETFRCDLVFVARQALNDKARALHGRVMTAYRAKDIDAHRQAVMDFMQLLTDMDELLGTDPNYLLGSWLEDAKRWGETEEERAKLEWNARRVLTLWGNTTQLRDYSRREWSGMISGFYGKRWKMYFDRQTAGLAGTPPPAADIVKFETDWASQREIYPAMPQGDPVAVAQRLFNKYFAATPEIQNLATGKPVTCSLALPGMDASFANDGVIDTDSYWGTDVSKDRAAWWQVDFEALTKIGRVVVVGYFGDGRHYGFKIEGSRDGKTWDMLADRSTNIAPSTQDGYPCQFAPAEVRFLRVTMTANSANTGRHLVEVMAFETPTPPAIIREQ